LAHRVNMSGGLAITVFTALRTAMQVQYPITMSTVCHLPVTLATGDTYHRSFLQVLKKRFFKSPTQRVFWV